MKYDWDATTYDHISDAQESWGHEIIEYRKWQGNEIVLDAGCGSGRLTKILSIKVSQGKVIAVDSDLSMIRVAKENLAKFTYIEFRSKCNLKLQLDFPLSFNIIFQTLLLMFSYYNYYLL